MKLLLKPLIVLFFTVFSFGVFAEPHLNINGDFRFRTENIREQQAAPLSDAERTRQRLRLRLGATSQINDRTKVEFKISTGSTQTTDNTNSNADLTDYSARKGIVLDVAYFNFQAFDELNILGGKTYNPYYLVGSNDLIFHADLNPEGLVLNYKKLIGDSTFLLNFAGSWLNERFSASGATDNSDVGLLGAQFVYALKKQNYNLAITTASYNFSNIKGANAAAPLGNSVTLGSYDNNYKLIALGLSLGVPVGENELLAYIENVNNSEVTQGKTATIYGLKYGQTNKPETCSIAFDFREVEKDAVVGILSESDVAGGGADIRSWRAVATYQLAENSNAQLTYLNGKRTISSATFSPDYQRVLLDFSFKF
jgi:hypothetical protein